MTNKFNVPDYTKVYFRLNSAYQWGSGWHMSPEQNIEYHNDCKKIALAAGLQLLPTDKIRTCISGVNELGEYLYFHPMDITGTLLKTRVAEVEKLIKEYESKYFSWRVTDCYEIRTIGIEPHDSSYHQNPNVIYETELPKAVKP